MAGADEALRERLAVTAGGYVTLEVPGRPAQVLREPEALARAADAVPRVAPVHQPTGRSVAALYEEILGAAVEAPEPSPESSRALAAARRLLFDDDAARAPSRAYRVYIQRKAALAAARDAGRDGRAEWAALQATQPGRIEAALATLAQHGRGDLAAAFAEARDAFVAARRKGGGGPYHPSEATPARFWTSPTPAPAVIAGDGRSVTRVSLARPWLRVALLSRGGWSVPGRGAGAYSNGRADASNTGLLPLIPIAFFMVWDEGAEPRVVAWESLVVPPCPP